MYFSIWYKSISVVLTFCVFFSVQNTFFRNIVLSFSNIPFKYRNKLKMHILYTYIQNDMNELSQINWFCFATGKSLGKNRGS